MLAGTGWFLAVLFGIISALCFTGLLDRDREILQYAREIDNLSKKNDTLRTRLLIASSERDEFRRKLDNIGLICVAEEDDDE